MQTNSRYFVSAFMQYAG